MGIKSILKSIWRYTFINPYTAVIKYVFQRPMTEWYGEKDITRYQEDLIRRTGNWRGILAINKENCIECYACVRACPNRCIHLEQVDENENAVPFYYIGRCLWCHSCVEACNHDALHFTHEFEFHAYDFNKEKLLLDSDELQFYFDEYMEEDIKKRAREIAPKKREYIRKRLARKKQQ